MTVVKLRATKGSIRNLSNNNQQLLEKIVFNCQDTLLFSSPHDRVLTLGADQLNYLLKPGASLKTYTVSVLPNQVYIRPGRLLTSQDFQLFFKEYRLLALGKEIRIKFNTAKFPLTSENYFVAYYQQPGKSELVEMKIPVVDKKLIFHQDSLYRPNQTVNDPTPVPKLNLYYRHFTPEDGIQYTPLGSPDISFADSLILKQEIGSLLAMDLPEGDSRLKQLGNYLFMMYEGATVNRNELRKWVKSHFGIDI